MERSPHRIRFFWQDLWPRGGLTLKQPVPEGLCTLGRTHIGAVPEGLYLMGGTPPWRDPGAENSGEKKHKS